MAQWRVVLKLELKEMFRIAHTFANFVMSDVLPSTQYRFSSHFHDSPENENKK